MTDKPSKEIDRRSFVAGAIGAAAGIGALLGERAQAQPPAQTRELGPAPGSAAGPAVPPEMRRPTGLFRLEADVRDCQVTGKVPTDLNGAFYRVGPDAQYPLHPRNIPFDGEGHVGMFRIKNGRVDFKSRMVRNERYLAQDKAGRSLFPIYRNPSQDDPSVKGLSRSTANTHIINHKDYILALKEDSPPTAMDLLTLETVVPNYTFDGQLPSKTFTAHPKIDSHDRQHGRVRLRGGRLRQQDRVDVRVHPARQARLEREDRGAVRRHAPRLRGDREAHRVLRDPARVRPAANGRRRHSLVVVPGPAHVLRLRAPRRRRQGRAVDSRTDAQRDARDGHVRRRQQAVRRRRDVDGESVPVHAAYATARAGIRSRARATSRASRSISRSADRRPTAWSSCIRTSARCRAKTIATTPCRIATASCRVRIRTRSPAPAARATRASTTRIAPRRCSTRARTRRSANAASRRATPGAPEGSGYLVGVATRNTEGGRADLVILDAEHLADGPVAVVHLPMRDHAADPRLVGARGANAAEGVAAIAPDHDARPVSRRRRIRSPSASSFATAPSCCAASRSPSEAAAGRERARRGGRGAVPPHGHARRLSHVGGDDELRRATAGSRARKAIATRRTTR